MTNDVFLQILAAFLFTMGMLVVLLRRDTIMILMGIELLLNAAKTKIKSSDEEVNGNYKINKFINDAHLL